MLQILTGIGLLFILLIICIRFYCQGTSSQRRHRRYRASAERVMNKLPALAGDAQRLAYLRKINAYVFEELLLLAFERQGLTVIRNQSYSADGGIDGQVFIDGKRWLIQAKRYRNTISPLHVQAFSRLLQHHQCDGFFIHTGRTGLRSRQHASHHSYSQLRFISGQRLLALLAGESGWR